MDPEEIEKAIALACKQTADQLRTEFRGHVESMKADLQAEIARLDERVTREDEALKELVSK